METYRTFLRTCRNWQEFANAPKIEQASGLTLQEAREVCKEYNDNRTEIEQDNGTKLEFEAE
jgi:hypothetical protein